MKEQDGTRETVGTDYDQLCGLDQPLCAFAPACEMGLMKSSPGCLIGLMH
jgi:hypothetical protein